MSHMNPRKGGTGENDEDEGDDNDSRDRGPETSIGRRRYLLCCTNGVGHSDDWVTAAQRLQTYVDCGMEGFGRMTGSQYIMLSKKMELDLLDENAHAIELARCGYQRARRTCNECAFHLGRLTYKRQRTHGSANFPILPSREIRRGPLMLIRRADAVDQRWITYVARCQGCHGWKELRDFRLGEMHNQWMPTASPESDGEQADWSRQNWDGTPLTEKLLESARCNACFARSTGGKRSPPYDGDGLVKMVRHKYAWEVKTAIRHNPCVRTTSALGYAEVAALVHLRSQAAELVRRIEDNCDGTDELRAWYAAWETGFAEAELVWRWLMDCRTRLALEPGPLVDWALSRRGIRLT
ncbi:unnamed protein product [Parascedosporium putredinis]|uniref:Uncharacterized protein n=1 Tax=Parascedosporium putredinis TaxID=1442378 RepID=A0A9P1GXE7_9PEZI|nr:unnamed protein product [Parascedosporium putredinis]CAI7988938.1 unnamed protein product [Parascedosporium putredinis]